jgi:hypothetical protein
MPDAQPDSAVPAFFLRQPELASVWRPARASTLSALRSWAREQLAPDGVDVEGDRLWTCGALGRPLALEVFLDIAFGRAAFDSAAFGAAHFLSSRLSNSAALEALFGPAVGLGAFTYGGTPVHAVETADFLVLVSRSGRWIVRPQGIEADETLAAEIAKNRDKNGHGSIDEHNLSEFPARDLAVLREFFNALIIAVAVDDPAALDALAEETQGLAGWAPKARAIRLARAEARELGEQLSLACSAPCAAPDKSSVEGVFEGVQEPPSAASTSAAPSVSASSPARPRSVPKSRL